VTAATPAAAGSGQSAGPPAPTGRRFLAALYDVPALFTLALLLTVLLLVVNRGERLDATAASLAVFRASLVVLWALYYAVSWTRWGHTLGMRVWKLRVQRADGTACRGSDALLRLVTSVIAWLPLGLGVIAAAWDPERRAWHDRLSRTRVVTRR